ncbi:conserved hypothetical protein [Talaromyces stipitatus ATCC 10500]|uniref:Uncharacterized protein n=1 Tax=Talaromyces stipitatus (strain ATCC 10500 / CBS 375.48 / QM 6759 / NRRL 1006) TaxID=441959 RepID=B8MG11_TALSN|nr:uncharacterized protein TSTA_009960 [Talaromyces stipitatus ATCC 10500]EED15878.1 conserved hypothetical protein [Talaromyces stipitatus ATCC 10500]
MSPKEEKSFFLYQTGKDVDALCLGNLILGDYANPTTARHYKHRLLTNIELEEHASVSELTECSVRRGSSYNPGISVFTSGFGRVSLDIDCGDGIVVSAAKGKRVVLKRPDSFLNSEILKVSEAQNELRKWVSASRSNLFLKLKVFRTPKIWMLTGMYIFEDATVLHIKKQSIESSVAGGGLHNTVLDLMSIPVGASICVGRNEYLESRASFSGSHVWAAQYRLLEIKYLRVEPGQDFAELPSSILLYPNLTSQGDLRGSPVASTAYKAQFNIAEGEVLSSEMERLDLQDEDKKYISCLEDEIELIEEMLEDEP